METIVGVSNPDKGCLAQSSLMEGVDERDLADFFQKCKAERLGRKEVYFRKGEPAKFVYFLCKGVVKISHLREGSKELITEIVWAGQIFGEWTNYGEEKRGENAIVISNEAKTLKIFVDDFVFFLEKNPILRKNLRKITQDKYRLFVQNSHRIISLTATERIQDFFLSLIQKKGRTVGYEIAAEFPFTHQEVASITGTSRQTVTMLISKFRKANLIYLNRGSLLVRDIEKFKNYKV